MVEGVSRRVWHTLNLPAGTDVRRMREQLARVERRVTQLSEEVSGGGRGDGRRSRVG